MLAIRLVNTLLRAVGFEDGVVTRHRVVERSAREHRRASRVAGIRRTRADRNVPSGFALSIARIRARPRLIVNLKPAGLDVDRPQLLVDIGWARVTRAVAVGGEPHPRVVTLNPWVCSVRRCSRSRFRPRCAGNAPRRPRPSRARQPWLTIPLIMSGLLSARRRGERAGAALHRAAVHDRMSQLAHTATQAVELDRVHRRSAPRIGMAVGRHCGAQSSEFAHDRNGLAVGLEFEVHEISGPLIRLPSSTATRARADGS